MKTKKKSFVILIALSVIMIFYSCEEKAIESDKPIKIENTLKSVSLWLDSIPVDPANLLTYLERVNVAIDSIGYPDAGYKLWLVDSKDSLDFKIMIEGYWPDQKTYDIIHNHELYKKERKFIEKNFLEGMKITWHSRFTRVK